MSTRTLSKYPKDVPKLFALKDTLAFYSIITSLLTYQQQFSTLSQNVEPSKGWRKALDQAFRRVKGKFRTL
jgi:hypothetical protein